MRNEGCWIFISHSSKDIEKIRMIRNEFELYGQNPLAFHLKCLNTDTVEHTNELLDLIKREIESREWFVFCESEHSLNSKYVEIEREYVSLCEKKMIWKINLNDSDDTIKKRVKEICSDLQIYISYSRYDSLIANNLKMHLEKKDYYVTTDKDIPLGDFMNTGITNLISNISKKGLILLLLTKNSLNSNFVDFEIEAARQNNARVITFLIGDIETSSENFRNKYNLTEVYKIPNYPKDENINYLLDLIDSSLLHKINGKKRTIDDVIKEENLLQEIFIKMKKDDC